MFQNGGEEKAAVTLDYNAIFGNMYRDFLAANSASSASGIEATAFPTTTSSAAADSSKVSIPPECYAVSFLFFLFILSRVMTKVKSIQRSGTEAIRTQIQS